jgi:hypothetical protein
MLGAKNLTKGINKFLNWMDDRDPEEEAILRSPKFQKLENELHVLNKDKGWYVGQQMRNDFKNRRGY